ncbi:MAG: thiamine-phosphate kinase [Nitrospirota bacterium]
MRLSEVGELLLLERIRTRFRSRRGGLLVGIGDDAAVLEPPRRGKLLLTTDMMLEGVHFDLGLISPRQLGFKLVSVNVSDIYAMNGEPASVLLSMAVPGRTDWDFVDALLSGVQEALSLYGASLAGGDVSSSRARMSLSATVVGHAVRPLLRRGARPGDLIYATGPLGDSAAGLRLLRKMRSAPSLEEPVEKPLPWKVMEPLLRRHLMPVARRPGAWRKAATAMLDISDGLALDLMRLIRESGVGAVIEEDRIPVSPALREAAGFLGAGPREMALAGGEDYELLFTLPPGRRPGGGCALLGEITPGEGLRLRAADGRERALEPKGYRHFR